MKRILSDMKKNKINPYIKTVLLVILVNASSYCQPWNSPLRIAWSTDGITFGTSSIYQDSASVPCVIKWKADTLACVFQWFRQPVGSASWDKVAVKFSYNNGTTWTNPQPVNFMGMPSGYQRPFDPTIVRFSGDSLRMYFSSSETFPPQGDSAINTYSAKSSNGVTFHFEPGARVNVSSRPVVDPAVAYFNGLWRYIAPVGAPHEGAYYYFSSDGLNFSYYGIISSVNHLWIGNLMLNSVTEMRFYGGGNNLWFNSTYNGTNWNGYVNLTTSGGDPSVLKISENNYLIIYVGQPYVTSVSENSELNTFSLTHIFPNPFNSSAIIRFKLKHPEKINITIYNIHGEYIEKVTEGFFSSGTHEINYIAKNKLASGIYICNLKSPSENYYLKFIYIK
ncbi:MAG: T9SS type A sorting domain-containing protein [Ignavibacteria bacterium]|nr:T9SS type A sorting domain-containing protein [Ignavibacteria bacterium]